MEKKYFIIVNGNQVGPYERAELIIRGLTPDSYVWREGMENWMLASTLAELADLFYTQPQVQPQVQPHVEPQPHPQPQAQAQVEPQPQQAPQQAYYQQPMQHQHPQQPQQPQQPYYQQPQQPMQYGQQPYNDPYSTNIPHTNWMTWAIIATVFGFLCSCIGMIFGIIGIVKANNANKFYAMGDRNMGDYYNSGARTWTIVALVVAGLGIVLNIIYWVIYGSYIGALMSMI